MKGAADVRSPVESRPEETRPKDLTKADIATDDEDSLPQNLYPTFRLRTASALPDMLKD